jgi:class 3 adenylate cyclase
VDAPTTCYARSGGLQIAYQVAGEGPPDIVLVPTYASNIELAWETPMFRRFLARLASFSRLIVFDRRGNAMSGGVAGATPLEEQVDDVRAVVAAVGSEDPVLLAWAEGCGLAALYAASHPETVRALIVLSPVPRLVAGPGYEWALGAEERAALVARTVEFWGTPSPQNPWIAGSEDPHVRALMARWQRLAMNPDAAAAMLATTGEMDVRDVLPSVQCPTLVLRPEHETYFDERHSRYVAEHVADARLVALPGAGPVWVGAEDAAADEIAQFLTGVRRPAVSDRVLATVLFTDIVGSTERAVQLGDERWRSLLRRHDDLVRDEVRRYRGRVVKSLGDGALAVFDGPSRAISSAAAIRERVRELGVEVRAGLHTGECELLADDDVGGLAVHIGARLAGLAAPGEILVSSTVRDLIAGSGQALADHGEHELKGVPGPWRIFAVER